MGFIEVYRLHTQSINILKIKDL